MNQEDKSERTMEGPEERRADGEFVVPEPDGVASGVPFHEADVAEPEPRAPSETKPGDEAGTTVRGRPFARRGLSLKAKIVGSLALLTGLLILLGGIAVESLFAVSDIGEAIAGRFAQLARTSEGIQSIVYRMRDAEKDFLLQEEQEALDRVNRHANRARAELDKARALDRLVGEYTHRDISAHIDRMAGDLDEYGSRFSAQVEDIKAAREELHEEELRNIANLEKLNASLIAVSQHIAEVLQDHWRYARAQTDFDSDNIEIGVTLERLYRDMMEARLHLNHYFSTGSEADLDEARGYLADLDDQLDRLRHLDAAAAVSEAADELRRGIFRFNALLKESVKGNTELHLRKGEIEARISNRKEELRRIGDRLIEDARALAGDGWDSIEEESEVLHGLVGSTRNILSATAVLGALAGIAVLILLPRPIVRAVDRLLAGAQQVAVGNLRHIIQVDSRDELGELAATFNHMLENLLTLVQRIQRASIQLSSSVNEIQAASSQQASSANEQASAINQLSASLNEISQSAGTLVSSSETVSGNILQVADIVADSNRKSEQALESMQAIGTSNKQTAERIKALSDKMDTINDAVGTISLVADQTTLLSLNAAIEANKAGEMGKGFSVVATEIRRLSDRSIDSASGISTMMRDIQRATESSAVSMDKSSEEVRNGIGMVQASATAVDGINQSMERMREQTELMLENVRAQAESSRMVQSSSGELLSSSNLVAKAASQTSAIAYELNAMASQLASAVSVFKT